MVFLNGIHGSGKSYLCERLKKSYSIPIYTASQLIAEYKNEAYNSNKFVNHIDYNQYALIEKVRSIDVNQHFILDGHLCLLNNHGKICRIKEKIIGQLNPKIILTKTSKSQRICQRLKRRDNCDYDIELLEKFQKEEIEYAKELSIMLKIKQFTINDDINTEKIIEIIRSVHINGRSI